MRTIGLLAAVAACAVIGYSSVGTGNQTEMGSGNFDDSQLQNLQGHHSVLLEDDSVRSLKAPLNLRGRSSSSSGGGSTSVTRRSFRKPEGAGFKEMFAGIFLIWCALPMIWMNERKEVKVYQVIQAGQNAYVEADPAMPKEHDKFALVHMTGRTSTFEPVGDSDFGIQYMDTIKLKRIVEVYQWNEIITTQEVGEGERRRTTVTYTYEKEWSSNIIDQRAFDPEGQPELHCEGPVNPDQWPCESQDWRASAVNLGVMELIEGQISRIDDYNEVPLNSAMGGGTVIQTVQEVSSGMFQDQGWLAPQANGNYVVTRPAENYNEAPSMHQAVVGDMRIFWEYVQNQDISILAQQVETGKGTCTFRPWNPKFIEDDSVPEEDIACPMICLCCCLIERCFKGAFKLHIDELKLGIEPAGAIFSEMINSNNKTTLIFRWLSWFLSVIGHYLLFTPILRLVSWIPLVGWLIVKVLTWAAIVFSLVWATALHFLVLSIAWVFYRPLFGVIMLLGVGVCLYFMFGQQIMDSVDIDAQLDRFYKD